MGGRCAEHAEPPSPPFSPQSPPADLSLRQPWKAHGTRSSNLTVPSAESRKRLRFDCSAARYFGTRGGNPARIDQRTGFAERPGGSRFAAARPFFGLIFDFLGAGLIYQHVGCAARHAASTLGCLARGVTLRNTTVAFANRSRATLRPPGLVHIVILATSSRHWRRRGLGRETDRLRVEGLLTTPKWA